MAEQREKFLLSRSEQFNLAIGAENRTDLTLTPNPDVNKSVIISIVTSESNPVPNALVKVLTQTGDPIDHQFTDTTGQSTSTQLPSGVYQVVVSAPGFLTSFPVTVNLPGTTGVIVNVSLALDPRAAKNTLYGLILDAITGARLSNATVILSNTEGQIVNTTLTNSDGEYLLSEVDNGSYTIVAEKSGYGLSDPLTINVSGGQIAQTNISLSPGVIINGTVQGFIKDQYNNFLAGAFVGLYSVTDSTETLIQETFTNSNGFYLFGNITTGNYLVKAKQDIIV